MDEYGFAASARVGMRLFEYTARNTGRTMRLIERVTDHDRIVVPNVEVQRWIRQRLNEAGKKTTVHVMRTDDNPFHCGFGTMPAGRTFFEHTWVREFFERAIDRAEQDLDMFQKQLSKTWPEAPEVDKSAMNIARVDF